MSEVEKSAIEVKPVAKIDAAAEKAYAEASAKAAEAPKVTAKPAPKAVPAVETVAAPKTAPAAATATPVKKTPATKTNVKTVKKAATKTTTAKTSAKTKVAAKKAVKNTAKPAAAPKTNPIIKLKDTIMATAQNTDITATAKDMLAGVQTRAKTAYAKTGEFTAEAGEFTKANVDAVVESGKIFFAGAQELLRDNLETGKTVMAIVTEDAKKVAAIKSPTELMQLQGEIVRRNFDAVVSFGSKRTEAWMKLTNEAFAPISNRVSVAAEKIKKAA
jgi:phasin family protein